MINKKTFEKLIHMYSYCIFIVLWVDYHLFIVFQTGLSALHVAAHFGQVDFVREMLTKVPATVKSEPPVGGDTGGFKDFGSEVNIGFI